MSFKAPYLSKDDLRGQAHSFLSEHNPDQTIPVPIELIIESRFGMDIVPIPGLQHGFDIVAFVTKDLNEIRVDEYIYLERPARYRFSLAHELAHRVLHSDLWPHLEFVDVQSWKEVISGSIPDKEYGFIEFHANEFAGLVLVPPSDLRVIFDRCMVLAKDNSLDVFDEATGARDYIESHIARHFCVSTHVAHRRVENDNLWDDPLGAS